MTGYAVTARYYDAIASVAHTGGARHIAAALAGLDATLGPIVDVGAGTGLTTALIATTLSDAEIFAVEPDPAMLAALMTRIWSDPDLRRRVTILPFAIADAPLPERIAGAVLGASLVHFGPDERSRLWTLLKDRLAEGGRIVVEVQCPSAEDMSETEMATAQVGRVAYRGFAAARRVGPDRQRWEMTYRSILEGRELVCERTSYDCWTISAEAILEEAKIAGLTGSVQDDTVVLLRLAP